MTLAPYSRETTSDLMMMGAGTKDAAIIVTSPPKRPALTRDH